MDGLYRLLSWLTYRYIVVRPNYLLGPALARPWPAMAFNWVRLASVQLNRNYQDPLNLHRIAQATICKTTSAPNPTPPTLWLSGRFDSTERIRPATRNTNARTAAAHNAVGTR